MNAGRRYGLVLAAAAAMAAAVALQLLRDRAYPRDRPDVARVLYVRSGEALKRVALSYDALASDVYWVRTLQHYGGDRLDRSRVGHRYDMLYPLLDLTTTLDPYFNIAYRFGAVFLSEPYPGGPGRPDQAVALLRKAMAVQPLKWQYVHDTAFVYFWHLHDYAAAASWFERAAALPNAPNWLRPMAATMLTRDGDRAAARFLWQQILNADQEWLRRTAERALLQLDALDWIERIEARIRAQPPSPGALYSWPDLIARGVVPGVPLDPANVPFEIDAASGEVGVSRQSPLFPMPDDQPRLPQ